jgi:hypothetical protein
MEKYKVTNITVKPVRKDGKGNDLRPAIERVGHPVQFRDETGRPVTLQAGHHCIASHIDGGLLGLQRGGFIKIEKIEDIAAALREHAYQANSTKARVRGADQARQAQVVQMGLDSHQQKSGAEYDGAVNPDGDPNFLVKATKQNGRRRRKGTADAADAGISAEDGKGA